MEKISGAEETMGDLLKQLIEESRRNGSLELYNELTALAEMIVDYGKLKSELFELAEEGNLKQDLGKLEKYTPAKSSAWHIPTPTGFGSKYSKTERTESENLKKALGQLDEYNFISGPERRQADFVFLVDAALAARSDLKTGKGTYRPLGAVMKTLQSKY